MNEEIFFMKCPVCGLVYPATQKDVETTAGSGEQYVPCPRRYTLDEVRNGIALKPYCTGYPEYPQCCHEPE